MRALWNTFSPLATVLAIVVAFGAWLYVSIDQASFYGGILWSTIARVPLLAFGLYVYLAIALNLAGSRFRWSGAGFLISWLFLGLLAPVALGGGLVLCYGAIGWFIPSLFIVKMQHGFAEHLAHTVWIGFAVACITSAYLASRSFLKRPAHD
jgi:hypothetical protein